MTQARIQNPALTVPGALDAAQQLGPARRDPGGNARDGDAAREPDQRLQRVRGHPHA